MKFSNIGIEFATKFYPYLQICSSIRDKKLFPPKNPVEFFQFLTGNLHDRSITVRIEDQLSPHQIL